MGRSDQGAKRILDARVDGVCIDIVDLDAGDSVHAKKDLMNLSLLFYVL